MTWRPLWRAAFAVAALGMLLGAASAPIVAPPTWGDAWSADEIAKLDTDLDALLANARALRGAHAGLLAVDTRTGATLYARAADDDFQPASTLKLVVGSAALEKLGPASRFTTNAYTLAEGTLQGALVIRGGGDPTLTRADLASLGPSVAQSIRHVRNDVFVDDTRYDRRPYPAGWVWDDFAQDYAPVISALTIDGNVREYTVQAGSAAGRPVRVSLASRVLGTPIEGCADARSEQLVIRATTSPASALSTLDVERLPGDCSALVGTKALGSEAETIDVADVDPALEVRRRAVAALESSGVAVDQLRLIAGPVAYRHRGAIVPDGAHPIWSHESKTLSALLGPAFWIPSDNLFAELLLKELGFATAGAPGSTEKGLAFERAWLQTIGVDPATLTLADGSGLSQYDRMTPRALVAVLQHDWNGPNRQLVLDSLPVGGARGTIEGVAGTAASGRVFAKTGSMSHVRGLAGFLATQRHGAVTFAFNVDDWNGDYTALAALRAQALARIVTD